MQDNKDSCPGSAFRPVVPRDHDITSDTPEDDDKV